MLKSKKYNTQTEWLTALEEQKRIAETPSGVERAESLLDLAESRIPEGVSVYGWSGGKDAVALQCVCERAGIDDCVLGTIGFEWEFPAFVDYVQTYKPSGLVIKDFSVTPDFLNKNEGMVFPETSKDSYKWFKLCNQQAYYSFAKERGAENIILGHRKSDGNVVSNGRIRDKVFPLWDFSHEDIFLILSYCKKPLSETYFYPNGFYQGTGAWIMRFGGDAAMDEVFNIDKNTLHSHRDVKKIDNYLRRKDSE